MTDAPLGLTDDLPPTRHSDITARVLAFMSDELKGRLVETPHGISIRHQFDDGKERPLWMCWQGYGDDGTKGLYLEIYFKYEKEFSSGIASETTRIALYEAFKSAVGDLETGNLSPWNGSPRFPLSRLADAQVMMDFRHAARLWVAANIRKEDTGLPSVNAG